MPNVMRLREAMEQEEGWTRSGPDAMDCDIRLDRDVEFGESFKHFGIYYVAF